MPSPRDREAGTPAALRLLLLPPSRRERGGTARGAGPADTAHPARGRVSARSEHRAEAREGGGMEEGAGKRGDEPEQQASPARPELRAQRRDAQRRSLPASEQPRPGQGRGELLAAAGGPRRSPRPTAAPASLRPASPRHLPNLCPTMARPYQPLPGTTSGAGATIERRGTA